MEEQVIQCPQCSKRYRLKGNPPPTFTCRNCGTVMDLSGFRQEAAPAAAAPARSASPRAGGAAAGGAAPHRRHHRRAGSAPRSRGRGAAQEPEHDEAGHPHYAPRRQGPDTKLIIGSIALVVFAMIALLIYMSGENARREKEAAEKAAKEAEVLAEQQRQREEMLARAAELPQNEEELAATAPVVEKDPKPVDAENARPELAEGDLRSVPIPEGKTGYMASQAPIQTYEWPAHVTAEERNKIEEAIVNLVDLGGRDGQEAEEYLVSLDRDQEDGAQFKAVGRLISEFKNRIDKEDMSDPLTMAKFMAIDRVLRKIDGMMDRDFKDPRLNIASSEKDVLRVARFWNWWYDLEKWHMRREPWDERLDELDAPTDGGG